MQPEEFPLLMGKTFVIMMFHTVDVHDGSGQKGIGLPHISQDSFPGKRIEDQIAVKIFSLREIRSFGSEQADFLYIEIYYYHGRNDYFEKIQSGFIVGFSLLNAEGVACAGEGDIKTALAMKIADICNTGGSFCEIVAGDFNRNTMILGHDGPFHLAISKGRPILRGMGVYHGKRGSGVSVEAKVKSGPVTTLGVTQTRDGKLKFNISEGEAIDAPILLNGNTSTHIRFGKKPAEYMDAWFREAPTHHLALSVGHNKELFLKVADLLKIPAAVF